MHFSTTTSAAATLLLLATAATAIPDPFSSEPKLRILDARQGGQAFIPDQQSLDSCTGVWQFCDPTHCYQPSRGDVCCSEGYGCPGGNGGSYCLTAGYCCPNGVALSDCAAQNGVTLTAGFKTDAVTPTYTGPPATVATGAVPTVTELAGSETATAFTGAVTYASAGTAIPTANGTYAATATASAVPFTGGAVGGLRVGGYGALFGFVVAGWVL